MMHYTAKVFRPPFEEKSLLMKWIDVVDYD